MSAPGTLNLLVDMPVDMDLLGRVLTALDYVELDGTVELEDTEIVVIRVRRRDSPAATPVYVSRRDVEESP